MKIADLPTRFAIKLKIQGHTVYLADKPEWDGSWHTPDLGKARRYKLKSRAESVIKSFNWPDDFEATTEPCLGDATS
jgi:hypothetical protein